jgi:hypothetical protein
MFHKEALGRRMETPMTAFLARLNLKPRDVTVTLVGTLAFNVFAFLSGNGTDSLLQYVGGSAYLVAALLFVIPQMRELVANIKNLIAAFNSEDGEED